MATGNIDAVWKGIEKAIKDVEKAMSAVMDAADTMDEIIVAATAVGGKVMEIVPNHIKSNIDKLTNIAEKDLGSIIEGGQSSLKQLKQVIESIPYRDIKPTSPSENREQRKQMVNLTPPDLSSGPQSQLAKQNEGMSLEDFYEGLEKFDEQEKGTFSFDQIRESQIFGKVYDEDMMAFAQSTPASLGRYVRKGTQKIREAINNDDLQYNEDNDFEPTGKLQEGFVKQFKSPGIDAMPFDGIFRSNTISAGGHIVE